MYVVAVDVDGTIADLCSAWLGRYNNDYNDNLTPQAITAWDTSKFVKPECGKKIFDYLKDPSLYDEVKPIDDALDVIRDMEIDGNRVIYPTTTPIESSGAKYRWLKAYGFLENDKNYMEVSDKSLVYAHFLLDDGSHNIQAFRGTGIVYRQPWNSEFNCEFDATDWVDFSNKWFDGNYFHPTVATRPLQTREFYNILMKMYQVHLDKNADYSPANILGTGEIGLMTRIWDKVARLMNLNGFHIDVELQEFLKPNAPKNESIDDSLMDLSIYSIIWMLYRKGVWGK